MYHNDSTGDDLVSAKIILTESFHKALISLVNSISYLKFSIASNVLKYDCY